MALSPKDRFTFTWQIENFSMCPQEWGECIASPNFVVESLDKSAWQLQLYQSDEDILMCYLERIESPDSTEDVNVDFKLSYYCIDSEKTISILEKGFTFIAKPSSGEDLPCHLEAVFKDKDTFLPNDTLTIKCELWYTKHDTEDFESQHTDPTGPDLGCDTKTEMLAATDRYFEKRFINAQCLVRTGFRTERKSVFWPIRKFSTLRLNQKLSLTVASTMKHQPLLCMTFYLSGQHTGDLSGQIEIQRDKSNFSEQVFVKCRVSVPDAPMIFQYSIEDEYLFKSDIVNEVWELPSFNQVSSLFKDKYFDVTRDVLYLFFEFSFSRLGDEYHVSTDETVASHQTVMPLNAYNPFQNEFKNLYKDGKFSDSTLLVGNRKFKVHKNILSSKSSVFSAMYENDMKETQTGVVEITDMEADTVDRMLSFIYTDILEDLQQEDAVKLYVAADKYSVLPLKYRCKCILKKGLDVSNVCDVLSLADLHNDNDLLDAIQNFIQINSRKIFHSQNWKDLMKLNSQLAAKVMYKMLI